MNSKTTKPTRLCLEPLESRDLLAGDPLGPVIPMTNPVGDSVLPGYGFPGQYSTLAAGTTIGYPSPGVGFTTVPGSNVTLVGANSNGLETSSFSAPAVTTGVGQMTITNGANTNGIGSFATATAGFASEIGGRS